MTRLTPARAAVALAIALAALAPARSAHAQLDLPAGDIEPAEFQERLEQLIANIDQSISRLRKQIVVSTNAPFLPDLFMQLGELMVQKANAIYFIQAEKQGVDPGTTEGSSRKFPMVLSTQREAAAIFDRVAREFPAYERRPKALFLLATLQRSLGDTAPFIKTVQAITSAYPDTLYAARARILLGMQLTDKQMLEEARQNLELAAKSKFVFERNMAKYRLGIVYAAANQPARALALFEEVALDRELDREELAAENQALMPTRRSENLKREVLLDSLRVYTTVHEKNPKPVEFYLRIAPNESLYVETMERLAYRYIQLKRYPDAIEPLRVVGAKLADPEKVINIYRDVLRAMPPADRVKLPPEELAALLQKVEQWIVTYRVSAPVRAQVEAFFETQLRELGTKSHDLAKAERAPARKAELLARAREFYLLHLRHLPRTVNSRRVATNLADVYYLEGKHLESGEWYLRLHAGAYGALPPAERREAAKTAVFVLQQPAEASYYEQTRTRGLLLRALEAWLREDPAQKRVPSVMLLLLKTRYEQNLDPQIVDRLYAFARAAAATPQGMQAAELILDYYGTRYDLKGLSAAARRLRGIPFRDPAFLAKLAEVERTSVFKRVEQKVVAKSGYFGTGGGQEFLQAALSSDDLSLKDAAFRQALASSRTDRDIETYFKTATSLAEQQRGEKKAELLLSVAAEHARVGRFVKAFDLFGRILQAADLPAASRRTALVEQLRLAVLMKDEGLITRALRTPGVAQAPEELRRSAGQALLDWINTGVRLPAPLLALAVDAAGGAGPVPSDGLLAALARRRPHLNPAAVPRLDAVLASRCGAEARAPGCAWSRLAAADRPVLAFLGAIRTAEPNVAAIEPKAKEFADAEAKLRELDGSGDPYIDLFLADRTHRLNAALAGYLEQIARKQPELQAVLLEKTNETRQTGARFLESCRGIARSGAVPAQLLAFCDGVNPLAAAALSGGPAARALPALRGEPTDAGTVNLQKKLLVDEDRPATLVALADRYLAAQAYHQAVALAQIGLAENKGMSDELKVSVGCALVRVGQPSEALFQLKESRSGDARRETCLREAQALLGGA